MSLKRMLIHSLDNRVGRPLLKRIASAKASRILGREVIIGYEDGWYHQVGSYAVPDGPRFDYYEPTVLAWREEIPTYFSDAAELWFVKYKPKMGDVIVDIGAGRGEDVISFAQGIGPTGKVLAIEAHPKTYQQLKRFCELNCLHNVIAIRAALMDSPGSVRIEDGEYWESNTIRSAGSGAQVTATTLDQICVEHGIQRIDFLKMNIEGAESRALLGMRGTIARVSNICVCCHDFRAERGHGEEYRTRDFVTEFLAKSGFTLTRRSGDPRDYVRDHVFGIRPVEFGSGISLGDRRTR